jgi:hypothetical protein
LVDQDEDLPLVLRKKSLHNNRNKIIPPFVVVKPEAFIQVKEEEEDDDSDSPHFLGRSLSFTDNGGIQQAIVAAA